MIWIQKTISLAAKERGCHLITKDLIKNFPELEQVNIGLLNIL